MSVEAKAASLVFIPFPAVSHLVAAVKMAKLLADRDERLSITILILKLSIDTKMISSYIKNSPDSRINFVELPENESVSEELMKSRKMSVLRLIESQKGPAREIIQSQNSNRLAGVVVDIFCTGMIDVANELGAPAYTFFTSGSAFLGLMFHLQSLIDDHNQNLKEFENSDSVISVPTYVNPVPARLWPSMLFEEESDFIDFTRRFRKMKGIIVNTFLEFEPHAMMSLFHDEKIPTVYSVGPVIQDEVEENDETKQKHKEIIEWLDQQPDSSVVFLCFGSRGCFQEDQVKEIAVALEQSGYRFLWSLRKPPPKEKREFRGPFENPGEVLPEGFLERTMGVGKVIGWAPQMAVLSHRAVGGFVSHCGWNSILESVWCGVPIAAWPLGAEQHVNAFQLVKELEMAVEIKMDYRRDSGVLVAADRIQKAIKQLMDPDNKIRVKVKELKEESRKVVLEGGSSYSSVRRLIEDFMNNIS